MAFGDAGCALRHPAWVLVITTNSLPGDRAFTDVAQAERKLLQPFSSYPWRLNNLLIPYSSKRT
jgi:hypothetical protein